MTRSYGIGRQRLGRAQLKPLVAVVVLCMVVVIGGILANLEWTPGGGPNASSSDEQAAFEEEGGGDFVRSPSQLASGVFMLGRCSPSVVYVIQTSTGLLLVDAGLEADASSVIQQLNELNLNINDTRAILLTHAHGDHALGARHISAMSAAKIYAGAKDTEVLRSGGPREAVFSTFPMDQFAIHPTRVDVELKGGEVLEFGDTRVQVIATPGHTPGSLCYLVERNHQRILLGGDTLSSLVGDLGIYAAYLPPRYRANASDYLASLRKLRKLPVPDLVLPGHPFNPNLPSNPRLSETDWHHLLDRGIRELEKLVARYESDGADFLDGNPKELLTGLHYLGDHAERPIYALKTDQHLLWFDAPGGPDLVAFAEEQLKTLGEATPTAVLLTSCDNDTIAGLNAFLERFPCDVVAAEEGHAHLREVCPNVKKLITADALEQAEWFPVNVISLEGRGLGTVAYYFPWDEKNVLIPGKVPITLTEEHVFELANALQNDAEKTLKYQKSLQTLSELRPDLWLTAMPQYGQNANLYGMQWNDLIKVNLNLLLNAP